MSIVETSLTNCRICMNDSADQYISIFDDILSVQICELIREISNIEIHISDELSTLICTSCCTDLQKAIRLRRLFIRSETLLNEMLNKSDEGSAHNDLNSDPFLHNVAIEFVEKEVDDCMEDIEIKSEVDAIEERRVALFNSFKEDAKTENAPPEIVKLPLPKPIIIKEENDTMIPMQDDEEDIELPKSLKLKILKVPIKETLTNTAKTQPPVPKRKFQSLVGADDSDEDGNDTSEVELINEMKEEDDDVVSKPDTSRFKYKPVYFGKNFVEVDRTAVLSIPEARLKYSCCMCYNISETEEELIAHLYTHPERARRSEFRKKIDLAFPNHRKQGRKNCIKCMRSFLVRNLNAHLKELYVDQKFQCGCCGQTFGFYQKMRQHEKMCRKKELKDTEETVEQYECKICHRFVKSKLSLVQHLKQHNLSEEERTKFKCNICGLGYQSLRILKGHVHQHSEIQSHQCTMCTKAFRTSNNLKAHIRVHMNDRIFKCSYCENTYIHCTDKKRHEMSVHTGKTTSKVTFNLKFKKTLS
jgi:general transcription factor IIIA